METEIQDLYTIPKSFIAKIKEKKRNKRRNQQEDVRL